MLGTPVVVVFLRIPVASPAKEVPLILPTTVADWVPVTSPESDPVNEAALPVVFWLSVGTSPTAMVPQAGAAETEPFPVWVKNCLVADVEPANLEEVFAALP